MFNIYILTKVFFEAILSNQFFLAGTHWSVPNFQNLLGTRYPAPPNFENFWNFPGPSGTQIFKISMGTGVPLAPTLGPHLDPLWTLIVINDPDLLLIYENDFRNWILRIILQSTRFTLGISVYFRFRILNKYSRRPRYGHVIDQNFRE